MKQADLGLSLTTKRTRKREFLAQMEQMVPWVSLVELIGTAGNVNDAPSLLGELGSPYTPSSQFHTPTSTPSHHRIQAYFFGPNRTIEWHSQREK